MGCNCGGRKRVIRQDVQPVQATSEDAVEALVASGQHGEIVVPENVTDPATGVAPRRHAE